MTATRRIVHATRGDVWTVLTEAGQYGFFVVGTKKIRDADDEWPAEGTTLHHSVGIGPLTLPDRTDSLECRDGERLVVRAAVRPFTIADITFALREVSGGTEVTMDERTIGGILGAGPMRHLTDAAMWVRNHEVLRRLDLLVADRVAARSSSRATV